MIKEALFWNKMDHQKVHCYLCVHECEISESKYGICGARQNRKGILYTVIYGNRIAAPAGPVERNHGSISSPDCGRPESRRSVVISSAVSVRTGRFFMFRPRAAMPAPKREIPPDKIMEDPGAACAGG
ncbi:MAG: hypothetical protein CVU71_16475 [Deltaproteobacteria bacterium HGW-Deltaproteobacteria-6]|nr:MAG: hypothetical protein CVU71_16475 [Deltaproteobacteria bacterium HGW-Deltaproteobacteria-6]